LLTPEDGEAKEVKGTGPAWRCPSSTSSEPTSAYMEKHHQSFDSPYSRRSLFQSIFVSFGAGVRIHAITCMARFFMQYRYLSRVFLTQNSQKDRKYSSRACVINSYLSELSFPTELFLWQPGWTGVD
jgi:hypothetical protein